MHGQYNLTGSDTRIYSRVSHSEKKQPLDILRATSIVAYPNIMVGDALRLNRQSQDDEFRLDIAHHIPR